MLHLVGDLYDAATDLDKWPVFLRAAARLFNSRGAQIIIFDQSDHRINMSVIVGFEDTLTPELMQRYQELMPTDQRVIEWESLPGKPQHERQFMSEKTLHESQMYQEVLKPLENEYCLAVGVEIEPGTQCGIVLLRDPTGEQFENEDCNLLSELVPHIRRSLKIQKRIASLDFNNRLSLESMDNIPMGIIMTDEFGAVRSSNRMAQSFCDLKDGVTIKQGAILFENSTINTDVRKAILDGVTKARAGNVLPNQAFSIPRPSCNTPYSLIVSILWGNHICIDAGMIDDPVVVLYFTDPDQPIETEPELLCRLFGLTPAEANLVKRLINKLSLKEAAQDQNIAESTARQHLKNIFSKMNCSSQKDMVACVLTSPAWVTRKI